MNAKQRRKKIRAQRPRIIGARERFQPFVNGKLGEPLYKCDWCGEFKVRGAGALCDDCIPF